MYNRFLCFISVDEICINEIYEWIWSRALKAFNGTLKGMFLNIVENDIYIYIFSSVWNKILVNKDLRF